MTDDMNIVARWMDDQGIGTGELFDIRRLTGGTQNVLVSFRRGNDRYVLRRPPENPRPQSNTVLRREIRVLAALRDTPVQCPRLIASCTDESRLGVVFYLTEFVEGFNPAGDLPSLHKDPTVVHEMGLRAVDVLTELSRVDPDEVGLSDFGKLDGFLTRQVARWRRELDSYADHDGYPGVKLPHLEALSIWLDNHRPRTFHPGLMHGDFHPANLIYDHHSPEVVAIVDWEMSTLGDPLLDFGRLLAGWPTTEHPMQNEGGIFDIGGLPTPAELIHRYNMHVDRDQEDLKWYTVLACYKLGIVIEGTHARACARLADATLGAQMHRVAIDLFERGHRVAQDGLAAI